MFEKDNNTEVASFNMQNYFDPQRCNWLYHRTKKYTKKEKKINLQESFTC